MKKKVLMTIAMLTVALACSVAAFAQNPTKGNADPQPRPKLQPIVHTDKNLIGTQVKLGCTVNGPSEFPVVTITNNVSASIPAGTKLFWQVNSSMKGTYTLPHALFKGMSVKFDTEAKGAGGVPTAWYFK